ncbi:SDR family NAD(P)-dependent oxidoreductase [Saccharopolyspora shandongensis]|uniref:SDR family NAD(P)-dependent oxidoreductase n=1 Tax=Saccharopolyspora shandongensis TaxID=418495 RepID=UPI0033D4B8B6
MADAVRQAADLDQDSGQDLRTAESNSHRESTPSASVAGHRGSARHAHYAATKGALLSFSRSLAWELGDRARINVVSPGIIETPMTNDLVAAKGGDLIAATPMGRLGKPGEVASVVAFLCPRSSGWSTPHRCR